MDYTSNVSSRVWAAYEDIDAAGRMPETIRGPPAEVKTGLQSTLIHELRISEGERPRAFAHVPGIWDQTRRHIKI